MCFKPNEIISTLSGKPLKLADQFTYFGSNTSSTESDANILIGKTWTAYYRLSSVWKSYPSDKMKRDFFQAVSYSLQQYEYPMWVLMKRLEKI